MKNFFRKLFGILGNTDNSDEYKFTGVDDLLLKIAAMRALGKFPEAIALYEKYGQEVRESIYEVNGLSEMIKVAEECANTEALIKYAKRLKAIEPEHPFVTRLSKTYML